MNIRCVQCTAQIPIPPAGDPNPVAICPGCGKRYKVSVRTPPPAKDLDRYRRAREFAVANKISEANAYSILEGLMTLEEARTLKPSQPSSATTQAPQAPRTASAGAVVDTDEWEYDSGFDAAVRHGHLTPRQAAERGDRAALARRMSERHRIPMHLALMVADNRMTVAQALGARRTGEAAAPAPRRQSAGFRPFLMVVIIIAITAWIILRPQAETAAVGASGLSRRLATAAAPLPEPAPSASATPDSDRTNERIDATGQLVEVTGPDPRNVLMAYCEAGAGTRQAIEILPAVPPNPGLRYGLFYSLSHGETAQQRVIPIRKDAVTGRWVAGNGRSPIVSMAPPLQPSGTRGSPVSGE